MFKSPTVKERHDSFVKPPETTLSPSTNALLSGYQWSTYGTPADIRYQFPKDAKQLVELKGLQPSYVASLQSLSSDDKDNVKNILKFWENVANVNFFEDDKNYQIPIMRFIQKDLTHDPINVDGYGDIDQVGGYSAFPQYNAALKRKMNDGIGFNFQQRFNQYLTVEEKLSVIAHETGHGLICLKHPFGGKAALTDAKEKLTTFSVMNYDDERRYRLFTLIPVTPMPHDIDAAQFTYGINTQVGRGDDVYHLQDYAPRQSIFSWLSCIKPVVSLGWDNGGVDTVSAKEVYTPSIIDIRPYGQSQIENAYIMTPNIDIENVVGGKGQNKIVLNKLNNIVDIREAQKTSQIFIDPLNCGHKTIIGFNPKKDKLIFIKTNDEKLQWQLTKSSAQKISLLNETIQYAQGTTVQFDEHNSISLANVIPETLSNENNLIVKLNSDMNALLWDYFSQLPNELFMDFLNAFLKGAGFTFVLGLSGEILKQYHCTEEQIAIFNRLLQCVLILISGQFVPLCAGLAVNASLNYLGFSHETSERIASIASVSAQAAQTVASPLDLLNMLCSLSGSYLGCKLTLFATNKLIEKIKQVQLSESNSFFSRYHELSIWAKTKWQTCSNKTDTNDEINERAALLA